MSLHFDSFDLGDYLPPLSFHASGPLSLAHAVADPIVGDSDAAAASFSSARCYAQSMAADEDALLDSSPFLDSSLDPTSLDASGDLSGLVSPSPAPSSTSCGSSSESLYDDSDELSSLASAAPYSQHQRHLLYQHRHQQHQHQRQHQHQQLSYHHDAVHGLHRADPFHVGLELDTDLQADADMEAGMDAELERERELDMDVDGDGDRDWDGDGDGDGDDDECEGEVEGETATPALAAVPPAQIVQATVADPAFVPNPAFAKLSAVNIRHAAPAAATASPAAIVPASPTSTAQHKPEPLLSSPAQSAAEFSAPVTATTDAASAPAPAPAPIPAVKAKRKYTRRAKLAQSIEPPLAAHSRAHPASHSDTSKSDSAQQIEAASKSASGPTPVFPSPSSTLVAACVASACAAAAGSAVSELSAVTPGARCVSSEEGDDNASTISAHSQLSTQSAPLPHSAHSHSAAEQSDCSSSSAMLSVLPPVSVSSPTASPSSSPASSPRSVVSISSNSSDGAVSLIRSSMSFSLASLPTLPPPGKPGRKRKTAPPVAATAAADGADGASDAGADNASSDGAPLNGEGKRTVRLQRNRASAQLSRERKKRYMGELEERMKQLMDVNHSLEAQLSSLAVENAELKKRLGDDTAITPAVAVKKRARLGRVDSGKRSASGAVVVAGTGRAALLMFGIFISFALFYNLVGIDFHAGDGDTQLLVASTAPRSSNSPTYTPPFAGRLLQSLRDRNSLLSDDVAVKKEPLAIEPPPALLQPQPSQQPAQQQPQPSFALVAVDSSADNRALVVKDEHSSDVVPAAERLEQQQRKLYEPFASYRTHNFTSEATAAEEGSVGGSPRAHYVLCADAVSIQPLVVPGDSDDLQRDSAAENGAAELVDGPSRTAKRLRRSLGLPAPVSPSAVAFATRHSSSSSAVANEAPKLALSKDDQLLLWLPSARLQLPSQPQPHNASSAPAVVAEAELVQVRCRVQSLDYVSRA